MLRAVSCYSGMNDMPGSSGKVFVVVGLPWNVRLIARITGKARFVR